MRHLRSASAGSLSAADTDTNTTSYGTQVGAIRINTRVRTTTREPCAPRLPVRDRSLFGTAPCTGLPHVRMNSVEGKSIRECGGEGSLLRHNLAPLRVCAMSQLRRFANS